MALGFLWWTFILRVGAPEISIGYNGMFDLALILFPQMNQQFKDFSHLTGPCRPVEICYRLAKEANKRKYETLKSPSRLTWVSDLA